MSYEENLRKIINEKILNKGIDNIWFDVVLEFVESRSDRYEKPFVAITEKQKEKLYNLYKKRERKRRLICGLVPTKKQVDESIFKKCVIIIEVEELLENKSKYINFQFSQEDVLTSLKEKGYGSHGKDYKDKNRNKVGKFKFHVFKVILDDGSEDLKKLNVFLNNGGFQESLRDIDEKNNLFKKNQNINQISNFILPSVNTILYGPPGTGKTYNSIKYAVDTVDTKFNQDGSKVYHEYIEEYIEKFNELKTIGRIAFTTFHQSYGYEEFIEGIKPNLSDSSDKKDSEGDKPNLSDSSDKKDSEGDKPNLSDNSEKKISYKIAKGVFREFCEEARKKSGNCVFIIDEINRGNISKIFGELITLIEDSKREGEPEAMSVILPYSKEKFSVPKNVYILGTMNTADRSISLMDTALRRRFEFVEMMPDEDLLDEVVVEEGINIHEMLKIMNRRIEALYDREHTLGHAFFMSLKNEGKATINQLESIFKNKIIPLLQEYFYEDYEKIMLVLGIDPKNMDDSKFISVKSNDGLFKNSPEIDLNTTYQINNKAFEIPENYRNIYGSISNSGEADEN